MGEGYDQPLREWQTSVSKAESESDCYTYIIVGDNIDKRIAPRNMRLENQVQSLHYFNAYAVLSRVKILHLDDTKPLGDIKDLPVSIFLLSPEDCSVLRNNYVVHISRILVHHLPFLKQFKKYVLQHIEHTYSDEMKKKSNIVSLCSWCKRVCNCYLLCVHVGPHWSYTKEWKCYWRHGTNYGTTAEVCSHRWWRLVKLYVIVHIYMYILSMELTLFKFHYQ